MKSVKIADRLIGEGSPVFVVCEIGGNFTTLEEGKKEIELAHECGADAVKFQTFRADTLVTRNSRFSSIAGGANQFEMFRRFEVSEEWHAELFSHARRTGIMAFSTPSHQQDVDLLEKFDVPAYKTGSDDLTNLPFLKYVASKKKPVILSTGMSNLAEIREAVDAVRSTGNNDIILLHCVSDYPVRDPSDLNLRVIAALRTEFNVPVGFSDHSIGVLASTTAVPLGASFIEKHFTLDKKLPTPDAFFSADPAEMTALIRTIRDVEKALGGNEKKCTDRELETRREVRKSIIAGRPIRRGKTITDEDVVVKRPGTGISPKELYKVIGKKAARDIEGDELFEWGMLE